MSAVALHERTGYTLVRLPDVARSALIAPGNAHRGFALLPHTCRSRAEG
jgi:hypothetical protein